MIYKWILLSFIFSGASAKGTSIITCHDCAKEGCQGLVDGHPELTGRCDVDSGGGRCFIRKDPNSRLYWGCMDDNFWPDVPWKGFNGCIDDWGRSWLHNGKRRPMIWCFCDYDMCNGSIERLNQTAPGTMPTPRPTQPIIDSKEGPEETSCIYGKGPMPSCDHYCAVVKGVIKCSCKIGFRLLKDGRSCGDLDECRIANGGCSQICVNTPGSFYCACSEGYGLAKDKRSCIGMNECTYKNGGCSHVCVNTNAGYFCTCPVGYELAYDKHTCQDVNECTRELDTCQDMCVNTPGSYTCRCHQGFSSDGSTCTDIDECELGLHNCVQTCVNTFGSFMCKCMAGYTLGHDQHSCIDVNECIIPGVSACDQLCVNTLGSFKCSCRANYRLQQDGRTCIVEDPCSQGNGGCDQVCRNLAGVVQCSCREGYTLSDNTRCLDINECLVDNGGCEQHCTNTIGSYWCSCPLSGLFVLAPDRHSCLTNCPLSFVKDNLGRSCYHIVSPSYQEKHLALDYYAAQAACQILHANASLVTMGSELEKEHLKRLLEQKSEMLEGWQGWWTSARYESTLGEFAWYPELQLVAEDSPLWSFKKEPYADTCLWIMQPQAYDYTWGNFECATRSGYVCEISLPDYQ